MESKMMGDKAGPSSSSSETPAVSDGGLNDVDSLKESLPRQPGSHSGAGDDAGGDAKEERVTKQQSMQSVSRPVSQNHPELMRIMQEAIDGNRRGTRSDQPKSHQFWSTQPMPKYDEKVPDTVNEPVEVKTVEEVRKEPFGLPGEFFWDTLDINHPGTLEELYTLLHDNYVEDDDAMFRFRYSHEFLLWALKPPGWLQMWHLGVRVSGSSNKLVGFISAVPSKIRIRGKAMIMTEVNFLCVHKKLRSKRMAVILIKEITRRCNVRDIFQAVYTAGAVLPKPVGTCSLADQTYVIHICCVQIAKEGNGAVFPAEGYWHRSLNPQKLVEVNFSSVGKNMTIQRMKKLYKLPDEPKTSGFRAAEPNDAPGIHKLLTEYLARFELASEFTLDEVEHYFLPKEKIIYSYVVDDGKGQVTDFASFYSLPSTVVRDPNNTTHKHDSVNAAYSFYNVAGRTSWTDLMQDVIIMAKKNGFDVFNALDLMDNKEFITQLKFGIGDGNLNYYVYNWKCSQMDPDQIGLVLM